MGDNNFLQYDCSCTAFWDIKLDFMKIGAKLFCQKAIIPSQIINRIRHEEILHVQVKRNLTCRAFWQHANGTYRYSIYIQDYHDYCMAFDFISRESSYGVKAYTGDTS